MNDVLAIIKIYFKKYLPHLLLLLTIFSVLSFSKGVLFKEQFKNDFIEYNYSKETGFGFYDIYIPYNENTLKSIENYTKNFNKKITKDDFEQLKLDVLGTSAQSNLNFDIESEITIYNDHENIYYPNNESNQVLNLSKINSEYYNRITSEDFRSKLQEFKTESERLRVVVGEGESVYTVDRTKINSLATDISKVMPTFTHNTSSDFKNFILRNIDKSNNLSIKETQYSFEYTVLFNFLVIFIVVIIFGLEYHTNFGKFIRYLPYNKNIIFLSKALLAILFYITVAIVTSLINVWSIETSVLSELVSTSTAFLSDFRMFSLSFSILLLAIIFASFSGSVVSIFAMFLPVQMSLAYPYLLIFKIYGENILGINIDGGIINNFNNIFEKYNPIIVPIKFFVNGYYSNEIIISYIVLLLVLVFFAGYIYKRRQVEFEGKFFMFRTLNKILLVIATISFAILPTYVMMTIGVNNYLALFISYIIITPIMIFLFNIKLKI